MLHWIFCNQQASEIVSRSKTGHNLCRSTQSSISFGAADRQPLNIKPRATLLLVLTYPLVAHMAAGQCKMSQSSCRFTRCSQSATDNQLIA
jgi:hypothetical protein